jgi:hypothetical protein
MAHPTMVFSRDGRRDGGDAVAATIRDTMVNSNYNSARMRAVVGAATTCKGHGDVGTRVSLTTHWRRRTIAPRLECSSGAW